MVFLALGRFITLVARLRRKPIGVIARKLGQYFNLLLHHHLRLWRRYDRQAERRWSDQAIGDFANRADSKTSITREGAAAAADFLSSRPLVLASLRRAYEDAEKIWGPESKTTQFFWGRWDAAVKEQRLRAGEDVAIEP